MSHGNSNKQPTPPTRLDKLNQRIARLLGKSRRQSPPNLNQPTPTSDWRFLQITLFMTIFLWLLTGVYYLPENYSGVVIRSGKLQAIKKGLAVGIDYPYPFSEVLLIDSGLKSVTIADQTESYLVMDANLAKLSLNADFNYRIINPELYYRTQYQPFADLDNEVKLMVKMAIQKYVIANPAKNILALSKIVAANEVQQQINQQLSELGIKIEKLTFNNFSLVSSQKIESNSVSAVKPSVVINTQAESNLITLANEYSQFLAHRTNQLSTEFNQLLPQYLQNPDVVKELLYYKMLSSIPSSNELAMTKFQILNQSKDNLRSMFYSVANNVDLHHSNDLRTVDRNVNRQRVFKDR